MTPDEIAAEFRKENKLRFAVSLPNGSCSAVWSIFSHGNNIYICSRPIGHSLKLSLHGDERDGQPSLVCKVSHTAQHHKQHGGDAPRKDFCRWKRGATPPTGFLLVASIQFPLAHIAGPMKEGKHRKPLVMFEAHGEREQMAELQVIYSRVKPDDAYPLLIQRGRQPIGYFELAAELAYLVVRLAKFTPPTLPDGRILTAGPLHLNSAAMEPLHAQSLRRLSEPESAGILTFNAPVDGQPITLMEFGGVKITRNP